MSTTTTPTQSPFRQDVLKDHVALITGGGTGICFGIAQILGRHGAKIAITGRRAQVLDDAVAALKAEGIDAAGFSGDVRDFKSCSNIVAQTVQHFGQLDILINGAAGNFLCSADDLSPNAFQTVVAIDLLGTFNMSKAAAEALEKTKGSIINISATLHYGATYYQVHASAAKAGVDSVTRTLAVEWGKKGIRVNGIAPGPIKGTVGMEKLGGGFGEEVMSEHIPLRRFGTVHEIGYAALFLSCKGASGYVSGDTLVVDGASWIARQTMITPEIYQMISAQRDAQKKKPTQAKL